MNIFFDFLRGVFKQKDNAAELNELTYNMHLMNLIEIAMNMYEWHNLPDSVEERYLEYTLLTNGVGVWFKDGQMGDCVAKTMYGGDLDIYGNPGDRRAYAVNGMNVDLDASNSVLIFNNRVRTPSFGPLKMYARRLANIERTIDINIHAQRTPILITCDERQRLTVKNMYAQYNGNEPVIFGVKDAMVNKLEVIKTDAPYLVDKLQVQLTQVWNSAMTYLGIETANTEKAERLITNEVTSNLGTAEAQRYTRLNARRDAAKKINAMFGTKLEVDFRSNNTIIDTSPNGDKSTESEEPENGDVHGDD